MASENLRGDFWQSAARIAPAEPPPARASDARAADLDPRARRLRERAERWIALGEFAFAGETLREALRLAPEHPELLRLAAVALHMRRRYADAAALLRRADAARANDPLILNNLGSALAETGDLEGALDAFGRASAAAPELAASWFNLGKTCDALLRTREAREAFERALEADPSHLPARISLADTLKTEGRLDESAAAYRAALALRPDSAEAWAGLVGLKHSPLDAAELAALEALHRRADRPARDRAFTGFAYALALESEGRYAEAFAAAEAANAARRGELAWDAAAASAVFESIGAAFAAPLPEPEDAALGAEIVFLVGLPRSGSTLVEQILAAHSEVEGAGEIDDLPAILREESRRRGVDFPGWVGAATREDWARLGREYLARTARWRTARARSTDKYLVNWQLVGAIRAMLPGARIVDCRRDAVETCWSCLKHQFAQPTPYACSVEDIARYWRDYDALMRAWTERHPGAVFRHDHEALLAEPETRVRALLEFLGLPFEPACLRFHEAERDVRTASAGQVRAPLRREAGVAARYGALLDPLRDALGVRA